MTRLRCFAVAAAATIAVLAQTATASADPPDAPHATTTTTTTSTLSLASVGPVMTLLDALGLADKGAPSPALRAHAKVRTPTWLQPEPPKTPLFYSSLVVAKF